MFIKRLVMGAWGHGYFEDDSALDFMADIEDAKNPKKLIKNAFENAVKADYLEADEGNAVIVAAAYVDRQLNGTMFSKVNQDEPLAVDTFPERHSNVDFSDLKEKAVKALNRVLDDDSELNELWAENESEYPAWRQSIEDLIERLN
ncbi:DUF4259 domain-containing protein [Fibrella sp. WM1]|uniref:DUF4259 domain-containing protein n=1 Tax=Fibrella musci TaxID=3242485 RepID=UPI0035219902